MRNRKLAGAIGFVDPGMKPRSFHSQAGWLKQCGDAAIGATLAPFRHLLRVWDPIEAMRGVGFVAVLAISAWILWQALKSLGTWIS
jgi:hypothetical protein